MKKHPGFTLIELMIVVAVVGILAAIAYPSYIESVRKSNRAAAKKTMLQIAQQEEQYYSQSNPPAYVNLTTLIGAATKNTDNNSYVITLPAADITDSAFGTADQYRITAAPVNADPVCGNLQLTQTGVITNAAGAPLTSC